MTIYIRSPFGYETFGPTYFGYTPVKPFNDMKNEANMRKGLVAGSFLPPHEGHLHLIREAAARVDELSVFICSAPGDPIPGALRYACLKELFPKLRVLHLPGSKPFRIETPPFFTESWLSRLSSNLPGGTDVVFSSGQQEAELAQRLGARHTLIEPTVPVSSETILKNPFEHWQYLPTPVRPFFVKKVVLTGPESVGKTVLAGKLAAHFNTVWVEEYGRTYCEKYGNDLAPIDFAHIAGGQIQLEDEAARHANRVLFCDTDLIVTQIWGEIYFDRCPPWIIEMNHQRRYDGFLLLAPDIAWTNDNIRLYGDHRVEHFELLREELVSRNLPFAIISGSYEERFEKALRTVNKWLYPEKINL